MVNLVELHAERNTPTNTVFSNFINELKADYYSGRKTYRTYRRDCTLLGVTPVSEETFDLWLDYLNEEFAVEENKDTITVVILDLL